MIWLMALILILCALIFGLLLAVIGAMRKANLFPGLNLAQSLTRTKPNPPPFQSANPPAGGPPKAEDKSVILLTSERDDRILADQDE